MKPLSTEEVKNKLDNLDGWFYLNNSIEKEFTLKTFVDAIALIVKIGIEDGSPSRSTFTFME